MLVSADNELPAIPQHFNAHRSRNSQLLLAALVQTQPQVDDTIARFNHDRITVVLGTSTPGLDGGDVYVDLMFNGKESTDWRYSQQGLDDPSCFLSHWLAPDDPAFALSTACSFSARAIMSERCLIESGLVGIAIVNDADTLSQVSINGLHSLESLSPTPCQPFGCNRCGITIGEGAALMVLTRRLQPTALLDVGRSNDAYHISVPHPQGGGAIRAIGQALNDAGMTLEHVGYISLHGTVASLNDQIESNAVSTLFGEATLCSLTKRPTGHTLGATGTAEAAISMLILQCELLLPPQDFSQLPRDETLPPCDIIEQPQPLTRPIILSNSLASGGNNASILLGKIS